VSNVRRLQTGGRIFFVTSNLRRGVSPFADREFPLPLDVFAASRQRLGFAICGYVLMPDHWHALIWPIQPLTISHVLHDVKKASALKLHQHRRTQGPFWQHQFWDRFVRHSGEFSERLEYMHNNPVRRGLASTAKEWPWSSYNFLMGGPAARGSTPLAVDLVELPVDYRV
jgi:REP element-mobilizing transposase RayT